MVVPRSGQCDLRDRDVIVRLGAEIEPHLVVPLGAVVCGVAFACTAACGREGAWPIIWTIGR